MPKKSSPQRIDSATIRACADLLRHMDAVPQRAAIANALAAVLDTLSLRARTIVERCDMRGEDYGAVARALSVSERHLFRERKAALSRIAKALLEQRPHHGTVTVAPSALSVRIAMADALESEGRWELAAGVLERAAGEAPVDLSTTLLIHVARLYRDADHFARAYDFAKVATSLAARCERDAFARQAEARIAIAGILGCRGDWEAANGLAQHGVAELRALATSRAAVEGPAAIVTGLLIQAEFAESRGSNSAYALTAQACEVVDRDERLDPRTALGALSMRAMANVLNGIDVARSEAGLSSCYHQAIGRGLTRGSLVIAAGLAAYYRITGRPEKSIALLAPLVPDARNVGTGWVRCGVFSELGYASLATRAFSQAAVYIAELAAAAVDNPISKALSDLASARLHLARRAYVPALAAASEAQAIYERAGLSRSLGDGTAHAGRSVYGTRATAHAEQAAGRAIDVLEQANHPLLLLGAYRVMARVSGRRKYGLAVRRLLREYGSRQLER